MQGPGSFTLSVAEGLALSPSEGPGPLFLFIFRRPGLQPRRNAEPSPISFPGQANSR
jgi:hypothetical protein